MVVSDQRRGERLVDLARTARKRLATHALDDIDGRKNDPLLPEHFDQRFGQHDTPVCLLSQFGELMTEVFIVGKSERCHFQPRL